MKNSGQQFHFESFKDTFASINCRFSESRRKKNSSASIKETFKTHLACFKEFRELLSLSLGNILFILHFILILAY